MPPNWTHQPCDEPDCKGTTDCLGFPSTKDRINMAKAAYEEYAESDETGITDFALDALLFAQSQFPTNNNLIANLATQASQEWTTHASASASNGAENKSPVESHEQVPSDFHCKLCGDVVPASDLRDHLAGHSTAAESAIEDPAEFYEAIAAPDLAL